MVESEYVTREHKVFDCWDDLETFLESFRADPSNSEFETQVSNVGNKLRLDYEVLIKVVPL